jgi:nicotinic acid mononucleotide adenylyltransferase
MKKLLLLFTILLFISCSSEDDNETSEPKTFLEKNDGLGFYDDDNGHYLFFYNDDVFLIFVDEFVDEPCTEIREGFNDGYEVETNVTIITNDSERLKVSFNNLEEGDYDYTNEYVVDVEKNTLTETSNIIGQDNVEVFTYSKTTKTYSSLCN